MEYYIELITDALHLSRDEGQMSYQDYCNAIAFVNNGFNDRSKSASVEERASD